MQAPTKALEWSKFDALVSTAAKGRVFVLPRKTLVQGKTLARAKAGLKSAAKNVRPRAARRCQTSIVS